jgi:hypothetical protein
MEEIILHTDSTRSDSTLPLLLSVLFPECRVTVIPKDETARDKNKQEGGV